MGTKALDRHPARRVAPLLRSKNCFRALKNKKVFALRTPAQTRTHASSLTIEKEAGRLTTGVL